MKIQPLEFEKPLFDLEQKFEELKREHAGKDLDRIAEARLTRLKLFKAHRDTYKDLSPWQRVQIARHPARPYYLDYLGLCFTDFIEVKGDRLFGDDPAMPGGFAKIRGIPCVVVGHQKGRDVKENLKRNFGSAHPEGYRKALRLMKLAEKFRLPVVALVDTPGAFPGVGAEERHIAESIAVNLREMMALRTPIVAVVLGEGGSGGALGIAVADRVLMLENAYYSVISPEGCAAILWKHRSHAPEAAAALKLTAGDLRELGLIDDVVPEPYGGAHRDWRAAADSLGNAVAQCLKELGEKSEKDLLAARYAKFRAMGRFSEGN